jgi:hypothetical protein
MPDYALIAALSLAAFTAFCCVTILTSGPMVQRRAERTHGPHPAIRRRLRLKVPRRLIPSRPARGPQRRVSRHRERASRS